MLISVSVSFFSAAIICIKKMNESLFNQLLGLLAKPTHGHIIRLAPPLTINDSQVRKSFIFLSLYDSFCALLFVAI